MPRFLGLDWGEKRIGVATSDDRGVLAVGYGVWPAREADFFLLLERAVKEEDIGEIVVGYPITLRGEAGPKAQQVDRFIEHLEQRGYQVRRWDERYSTADVSRTLSEHGVSQRRQRGKLDMAAATVILQSYLDARRQHTP
jgi:putative Holliday junction resolvase